MRILVLGGYGYLGWPTALHLCDRGHDVAVNDNTTLTENVKKATDLLEEIHRHVAALSPGAGVFPGERRPPAS